MQNKAFSKFLILIILAVLVGGGIFIYQYWWLPKEEAKNHAISEAQVKEILIQKPNLVITGENLSEVQIYMVPTGTDVDPETMSKIENATKQSEINDEQVWIYQYPKDLLITNIFAKGFDNNGNFIGKIDLPIVGATALWDALYGGLDETADWKAYRSEQMGFEIKYPKDFTASDEEVLSTATRVDFLKKGEGGGENVLFSVWTGVRYSQELGRVYTLEEWIDLSFPSLREGESKNNIKFGLENYDGTRVDKYKEVGVVKLIPYVFTKDPDGINMWEFTGNIPTVSTDLPKDYAVYKIFNQILSTFRFIEATEGFCGSFTYGGCSSDLDCLTGGCSGQVCQSKNEELIITTCEWKDCYDDTKYGVTCGCVNNKCLWYKKDVKPSVCPEPPSCSVPLIYGDPPFNDPNQCPRYYCPAN